MPWWLVATALAGAQESPSPDAWMAGRWRVASETLDPNAPLAIVADRRELLARAWQVEAVLDCAMAEMQRPGSVRCRIEDVALRVATYDHWQRAADRALVEVLLDKLARDLRTTELWLVRSSGRNVVVDESRTTSRASPAVIDGIVDGFHVAPPPSGWTDGAAWQATTDPLLDVELPQGEPRSRSADHTVTLTETHAVLDSSGTARLRIQSVPRDPLELRSTQWRKRPLLRRDLVLTRFVAPAPPMGASAAGFGLRGRVRFRARASIDPDTDQLVQRRWSVTGTGAAELLRSGRVRRVGPDDDVGLGSSGQISAPEAPRDGLPPWTSILGMPP